MKRINPRIRAVVEKKYGGKCAYCGDPLEKGWHVDHVEPCRRIYQFIDGERRLMGHTNPDANHLDNYLPACASCNINKHGMTIEEFRESIVHFLKALNERITQYKMAKRYGLVEETGKEVVFYFETAKPQKV